MLLDDQFSSNQRAKLVATKGVRELTLTELRQWQRDPKLDPEMRRLVQVEIHKKIAIPAACLVFGLFAVPLGFNNRRGGKSSGFALSIAVIMAFYLLLSNGEDAAPRRPAAALAGDVVAQPAVQRVGRLPAGAPQPGPRGCSADASAGGCGWSLPAASSRSVAANRSGGASAARRAGERCGSARPTSCCASRASPCASPTCSTATSASCSPASSCIVMMSGLVLYILADFTDNVDDVLKHKPGFGVLFEYYSYMSLQILFEIAPILVLVTTLVTFALLSRTNEITVGQGARGQPLPAGAACRRLRRPRRRRSACCCRWRCCPPPTSGWRSSRTA